MKASTNPLQPGRYQVDLWSPTPGVTVRDGVPIFKRWREANAARVRVLHAESWNTEPRQTRVLFEVLERPGAWPFGQLGPPELASTSEVGVSFVDVVEFLFDPLGSLESSAAEAAAHFLADLSRPELQELRAALSVTKANIAIIRASLEAIKNGTAPDPKEALAATLNLIDQSTELLLKSAGRIPFDFPRNLVNRVLQDLHDLKTAIHDAPSKALGALGKVAKDFVLPYEVANLGGALAIGTLAWLIWSGRKSSKTTDNLMLLGAAAMVLGGGTLLNNLLNPKGKT